MSSTSRSILVVDDDPGMIHMLARILEGIGEVRFATNGIDALRLAHEAPPDLILLDAQMPGMNGFDVCERIKGDETLLHVPVVFITSHREPGFEVSGFQAGAADFIAKPIDARLVLARVAAQLKVKAMSDELRRISTMDALTGVGNRRAFDQALNREWRRSRRGSDPISLLMVDVDYFKRFNDQFGHPAGDACLRSVAQALAQVGHRPGDVVCRYGGEEFAILLTQAARAGAECIAERVLEAVAELRIPHPASLASPMVTVSVGVGCFDRDSPDWPMPIGQSRYGDDMRPRLGAHHLVAAADRALYAAKRGGRARWRATVVDTAQDDGRPAATTAQAAAPAADGRPASFGTSIT